MSELRLIASNGYTLHPPRADRWLRGQQAAAHCGISVSQLRKIRALAVVNGYRDPAKYVGERGVAFTRPDLDALIAWHDGFQRRPRGAA